MVDLSHRGPDEDITAEDLEACEKDLQRGAIALLRMDRALERSVESQAFWIEARFTTGSAGEWLVERGLKTVGCSCPAD